MKNRILGGEKRRKLDEKVTYAENEPYVIENPQIVTKTPRKSDNDNIATSYCSNVTENPQIVTKPPEKSDNDNITKSYCSNVTKNSLEVTLNPKKSDLNTITKLDCSNVTKPFQINNKSDSINIAMKNCLGGSGGSKHEKVISTKKAAKIS